jgi:hypothetical protein
MVTTRRQWLQRNGRFRTVYVPDGSKMRPNSPQAHALNIQKPEGGNWWGNQRLDRPSFTEF